MSSGIPNIGEQHVRLFRLTASILRDGVETETREVISSMPSVASQLTSTEKQAGDSGRYAALDRDVAYRFSAYVDRDQRAELDDSLTSRYAQAGLNTSGVPVDHVSNLLEYIALMADQKDGARATGGVSMLLYWIHPLSCAVTRFDTKIAETLVHFVEEMLSGWDVLGMKPDNVIRLDRELKVGRGVSTGLLAGHLASPDQCGMFLGRDDIAALGRDVSVPTGFGGRRDMMTTLIEGAVRYGNLKELLGAMESTFAKGLSAYNRFDNPSASSWRDRLRLTRKVLADERLADYLSAGSSGSEKSGEDCAVDPDAAPADFVAES